MSRLREISTNSLFSNRGIKIFRENTLERVLEKSSIKTVDGSVGWNVSCYLYSSFKNDNRSGGDRARLVSPRYFIKLIPDSLYRPLLFT